MQIAHILPTCITSILLFIVLIIQQNKIRKLQNWLDSRNHEIEDLHSTLHIKSKHIHMLKQQLKGNKKGNNELQNVSTILLKYFKLRKNVS